MSVDFTIVTIALNAPEALRNTLKSCESLREILLQTEHIVIDSSPETHRHIRAEFEGQSRIRWVESPAEGIYKALNMGTKLAQGNVIWHLHAGDLLYSSESLAEAIATLQTSDELLLYSPRLLQLNGNILGVSRPHQNFKRTVIRDRTEHPGTLFKREFFEKYGYFSEDYPLASDYELFLRAVDNDVTAIFFPHPFSLFGLDGASNKQQLKLIREVYKIQKEDRFLSLPTKTRMAARFWLRRLKIALNLQGLRKRRALLALQSAK